MIAAIAAHPHVFWLSLGGLLLAAEMLGAGGYLLWSGIAALVTGLLTWVLPLNVEWQGVSFALLTVASAFFWWRWLASRRAASASGTTLNQRGQAMIGRILTLDTPLINGRGSAPVGDGRWQVVADTDLPAGSRVRVIALEGITLRVAPCS
ncbi:NfeD family protein [Apirhabdus apintestini]|nr:NfeD family protein [Enterobacteriaceae bacterium CA-0114]